MATNFAAAFAVPALAIAAFNAGSTPAGRWGLDAAAQRLSASDAEIHASLLFSRADFDRSHDLEADEYAALQLVTAELARLNGYVVVLRVDDTRLVAVPVKAPSSLPGAERTRIEAVAHRDFYAAAGRDLKMSAAEFVAAENERFDSSDLNGDGALARSELTHFGARLASVRGARA